MSISSSPYGPPPDRDQGGIVRMLFGSIFGLIGLSFLPFACIFILIAGGVYYVVDYSRSDWVTTDGEVIFMYQSQGSYDPETGTTGATTSCPRVAYTTQAGEEFEVNSNECSAPPAYDTGDRVQVRYDPDNPGSMQLVGGVGDTVSTILTAVFGGIGSIFLCIGGLMMLGAVFVALRRRG